MPIKTWVSGEELKAADVNQYLQNQNVLVFADAAARTAAIPTPSVGMASYLTSTGYFEIFTDKTSPSSWRPPWSAAWGLTYYANVADITINTAPQFQVTNIPIQIPGRQYKVEFDTNVAFGGSAAMTVWYQFYNGGGVLLARQAQNNTWWTRVMLSDVFTGGPSNALAVQCWIDINSGASTAYARVRVFDIGPV